MTDQTTGGPGQPPPLRRRAWLLAFLAFFLLIGAWSVAAPYDGTPDEKEHVLRAAGVAAGQIAVRPEAAANGGGAFQIVPGSLVRENCFRYLRKVSAACGTEPGGDETPVRAATGAGRYHPIYYAIVGWPLRLSPDWSGILLARLISAALSAALLATAFADATRWSRNRLLVAGVLAAVTPLAAHMASAVNPNGLEIAAGVAFFAAAIPLLHNPAAARSRTLLWHVGVAALALALLRSAGPLWLSVSVAALVLPLGWRKIRELLGWAAVRWWMVGVAAAMAASVAWTLIFKTGEASVNNTGRTLSILQAARQEVDRWARYADEVVGVTGWLDTRMPEPGYLIWQYAAATLIIWAFIVAYRAGRRQLAVLLVAGLGIPFVMQVALVNSYGFITQGRYLLPMLVGMPILAAFLIQTDGLDRAQSQRLLRLYAVLLLPIHLVSLWYTMIRWQRGLFGEGARALNPFGGPWHPPLGSLLPLVAATAGILLIGGLVWRKPPDVTVSAESPAGARRAPVATPVVATSTGE